MENIFPYFQQKSSYDVIKTTRVTQSHLGGSSHEWVNEPIDKIDLSFFY